MFVAATTRCFADLPLDTALRRLVDLEYTSVEIMIHETGGHLKPSEVLANLNQQSSSATKPIGSPRLPIASTSKPRTISLPPMGACCKLAKATKVVTLTVRSAELGTPFNAEVERLREMVAIAAVDGIRVGLCTEVGRMSQDPNTAVVLCDAVKGLGVTLDPSHYVCSLCTKTTASTR